MPYEISYAFTCVFLAAIVRGFSGFGFALLTIISLSFVLPPATIVPAMFVLEVAAGIHLLPSIWKDIHWRLIVVMVGTAVMFTPVGVYFLANVPAGPMKLMLAALIFTTAVVLMAGIRMKRMPTMAETAATGTTAGILNGALGIGGPPIIIFFLGSPLALQAGRASIIAAFLAMDMAGLPALFAFGLFTRDSVRLAIISLPALVAGIYLGSRLAGRMSETVVRKVVLVVLMGMAVATAAQSLFSVSKTG
ncbi:sulfite exporter TauE/SafE family protein [Komagataeibacter diospyri]|uniref:Probable membrane transporter protein n=1 Tax=Komagataeibacter diospyri TaxID=1932662 RepID=A0A4P5NLL0_9PROT|nr:sulfite exporter TauE/SafE family protein [Komagataeibacter diospyri]GCE82508.1 putative permease [Komagataeibacter diospyri]